MEEVLHLEELREEGDGLAAHLDQASRQENFVVWVKLQIEVRAVVAAKDSRQDVVVIVRLVEAVVVRLVEAVVVRLVEVVRTYLT